MLSLNFFFFSNEIDREIINFEYYIVFEILLLLQSVKKKNYHPVDLINNEKSNQNKFINK